MFCFFLVFVSQIIGLVYSQNASAINVLNFTFLDHSVMIKIHLDPRILPKMGQIVKGCSHGGLKTGQ